MKHFNALLMKFIISLVVFWISLGLFFNASIGVIISFSLTVAIITYFIGDLMLLPRIGKMNTVVSDFFLVYLIVWVFGGVFFHSYFMIEWGSIISAALIAGSEVFVHSYILKNIKSVVRDNQHSFNNQRFAFEMAEDPDPNSNKEK